MSWQHIRGHEAQVASFDRAYRQGRLGHAFLFTGPQGVGKKLFATELAKAILCETASEHLKACDRCKSCLLFDGGTHPDFVTVGRPEDKNEFTIDPMRELCDGFTLKSARGRGKVAVLDDADDLNEEAANCFLKTLEEPPPRSVLVLVGTSAERQRLTIVSRCQVVRFSALPEPVLRDLLAKNEEIDAALLPRLISLSGGSPGEATALADPALWAFRQELLKGLTVPKPDTVSLAKAWMRFGEEAGKEVAAQRRRSSLALKLLIAFLRDALAWKLEGPLRMKEADDERLLQAFTGRVEAEQILALLDRCLEADGQIERYLQLVLVIEGMFDALGVILRGS